MKGADSTDRVDVVLVSHDTREQLRRTLAELLKHRGEWTRLVVVDADSQDGSPEMVRREFPDVDLLELEANPGFGRANNVGVEATEAPFVLLCNSDAWPESGTISRLATGLEVAPRRALVAPRLHYPDGRPQFAWAPWTGLLGEAVQKLRSRLESRAWVHRRPPFWLRPLVDQDWFTAACVLVRRTAFETVGGFDEEFFLYFEDVDLCRRLHEAGWQLAEIPTARAVHVKGGSSPSSEIDLAYRRSQLLYYEKHRPSWESALLRGHLRRKFRRLEDPHRRERLLSLLDG